MYSLISYALIVIVFGSISCSIIWITLWVFTGRRMRSLVLACVFLVAPSVIIKVAEEIIISLEHAPIDAPLYAQLGQMTAELGAVVSLIHVSAFIVTLLIGEVFKRTFE